MDVLDTFGNALAIPATVVDVPRIPGTPAVLIILDPCPYLLMFFLNLLER
jgi:hypothetical protein